MGVSEEFPDLEPVDPLLLAECYTLMAQHGGDELERALDLIGWDLEMLKKVEQWYRLLPEFHQAVDREWHFELLGYLLRRCARNTGFTRPAVEAALAESDPQGMRLGFPFWVPCMAMLPGRQLWVPLYLPEGGREVRAYAGLVRHLLAIREDALELQLSSVLWRVGALTDGLARDSGGLTSRISDLHKAVTSHETSIESERRWWYPILHSKFAPYRNALTHMVTDQGMPMEFIEAAEYALSSQDQLSQAASAVGCALVQQVSDSTPDIPDLRVTDGVWRDLQWIDRRAG